MLKILLTYLLIFFVSPLVYAEFARGADVSFLTEMEAEGYHPFYNDVGQKADVLVTLKEHNLNSVRLRVWVNPASGWCNKADLIVKAKRAKALGNRIMIDFHYSDDWTDPGTQVKPAAWTTLSYADLKLAVAAHATDVLQALQAEGITPEWVQVGNETNDGMLWPDGRATLSMANFAGLVQAASVAVKAVFPTCKVIIHLSNAYDNVMYRWIFDGMKANNVNYDVIGMSFYPDNEAKWDSIANHVSTNMADMVSRYNKEVMLVEIGLDYTLPDTAHSFVMGMISRVQALPNSKGLGVFWWEPECYNWRGYPMGVWGMDGKPTRALDGFLSGGVHVSSSSNPSSSSIVMMSSSSAAPSSLISQKKNAPAHDVSRSNRFFNLLGRLLGGALRS